MTSSGKTFGIVSEEPVDGLIESFNWLFGKCSYDCIAVPMTCGVEYSSSLVELMRGGAISGLFASGKHSRSFAKLCDKLDTGASKTGHADTIVTDKDGLIVGYDSMHEAIGDLVVPKLIGKDSCLCAVLGTGHAAVSSLCAMAPVTLSFTIASRYPSPGNPGMAEIDKAMEQFPNCAIEAVSYDEIQLGLMDIVINTTPVPIEELLPEYSPSGNQFVIDMASDLMTLSRRGWPSVRSFLYSYPIFQWTGCTAAQYSEFIDIIFNFNQRRGPDGH